ncbi:MAG: UDP-N-acetylmuramate--L-alanine ligase [Candidatus Zixiibacteriota bacterium]
MTIFGRVKKIHLIGIGGSGMSAIAEILLGLGYIVSGSDINDSKVIENLRKKGAKIYIGHSYDNINNADVLVYSSAITGQNPEIDAARDMGIPIIGRAEMLAELSRLKTGIHIAGTHGKSTTTSLIGVMIEDADYDPTIIVGGRSNNLEGNARLGKGPHMVLEADEFDKTFLKLSPVIAIVTNMEKEHMECYDDYDDLKDSFVKFLNSVPFYGASIICLDERSLQELLPRLNRRVITYGLSTQSDIRAIKVSFGLNYSKFTVEAFGKKLGEIKVNLLGLHNVRNTLAAVATGIEMGMDFDDIASGIAAFKGVFRRFQIIGQKNDILIVDDFAHHPTEVRATLDGARMGYDRRIIVVFQPHLYSRTERFADDFGKAFLNSDTLIVTSIYPAREKPIEGITGEIIAQSAKDYGHRDVHYIPKRDTIAQKLLDITKPGDMVLVLGAGNVNIVAEEFFKILGEK